MQPLFEVRRFRGETETHAHDFHQVVLPLAGRLDLEVDGVRGCVSARSVALVCGGVAHAFRGSKVNAFLVLDLPTGTPVASSAQAAALWDAVRGQPFVTVDDARRKLIGYLADVVQAGQLQGPLVEHACALLLGDLAAQLGVAEQGQWPPGLRRAVAYIDAHLEWPLTVGELARVAHISESRLHSQFRTHLACTPRRHVTHRRLRRAADLLAHTALPVSEVALRVGYADQAAFTRAFRAETGQAPLRYRNAVVGR